jgi:phosphoribosylcarboxyaminoimidazole (NCAIR) mutase
VQILALSDADLGQRIIAWRQSQTDNVAQVPE